MREGVEIVIHTEDAEAAGRQLLPIQPGGRQELSFLNRAIEALAEARSLSEVKRIHDQAEAVRTYARSALLGLEVQNQAAEIKLRAERKAGKLLSELRLRGGNRRTKSKNLTLKKLGIDHNQSHRWQLEASIPEVDFEKYLRRCRDLRREVTAAALVRLTKQSPVEPHVGRSEEGPLAGVSRELREIAEDGECYSCVYAAPAWTVSTEPRNNGPFRGFSLSDLMKIPVQTVVAEDAHLHLWVRSEWLSHAMRLLSAWGFTYRSVLVWRRRLASYGEYWRDANEFLLLGSRGHRPFRDNSITSFMRNQPASSDAMWQLIERVSPGPYLQIFGKGHTEGWKVIGT